MFSIGIDIGGMSIKAGLVDECGRIAYKTVKKTAKMPKDVLVDMRELINEILAKNGLKLENVKGIGIGCPGSISSQTGVVEFSCNLGWNKVAVVEYLLGFYNTKIKISNDAHAAALGEATYGVSKDYNSSVMFTLGTGVGGGVVIDKKLYEGAESKGTELGHTTLVLGGKRCSCGRSGCVEAYVSASALVRQTKQAMVKNRGSLLWEVVGGNLENVDGGTVFEGAKHGDKTAVKVFKKYSKYLAESMMNMFNIFRPEAFVLGGGISGAGTFLTDELNEYCERNHYGYKGTPKVKILLASLGNDAGIIGAASLVV